MDKFVLNNIFPIVIDDEKGMIIHVFENVIGNRNRKSLYGMNMDNGEIEFQIDLTDDRSDRIVCSPVMSNNEKVVIVKESKDSGYQLIGVDLYKEKRIEWVKNLKDDDDVIDVWNIVILEDLDIVIVEVEKENYNELYGFQYGSNDSNWRISNIHYDQLFSIDKDGMFYIFNTSKLMKISGKDGKIIQSVNTETEHIKNGLYKMAISETNKLIYFVCGMNMLKSFKSDTLEFEWYIPLIEEKQNDWSCSNPTISNDNSEVYILCYSESEKLSKFFIVESSIGKLKNTIDLKVICKQFSSYLKNNYFVLQCEGMLGYIENGHFSSFESVIGILNFNVVDSSTCTYFCFTKITGAYDCSKICM